MRRFYFKDSLFNAWKDSSYTGTFEAFQEELIRKIENRIIIKDLEQQAATRFVFKGVTVFVDNHIVEFYKSYIDNVDDTTEIGIMEISDHG